jgi:hypothetical protein
MVGRRKRFGSLNKKIKKSHNSPSNTDTGCRKQLIQRAILIQSPLPPLIIQERNSEDAILSFSFLVAHRFNFEK